MLHSCCRERQRATISGLEAQLSQQLGQLALLSEQQQKLRLRAAVLEATVCGREYYVSGADVSGHLEQWLLCGETGILCGGMVHLVPAYCIMGCWRPRCVGWSSM